MSSKDGKEFVYQVFGGDLNDLAEHITTYCLNQYGDECRFKKVLIERTHPESGSWKVHEFSSFEPRAIRAIENHLKARRDPVKVKFTDPDENEVMEITACKARNTGHLARFLNKEQLKSLDEDDIVILAVEKDSQGLGPGKRFIKSLE